MGSGNFMGLFRPKVLPNSAQRSLFVSMARKLASEQISYNIAYQLWYDKALLAHMSPLTTYAQLDVMVFR